MFEAILNKDLAQTVSYWATTVGIIVALMGAIGAYVRYRADRKAKEWDRARHSYSSFIDVGISNPEFYPGSWTKFASGDEVWKNKYRWFIARAMWASEEIVTTMPKNDEAWPEAISVFVREHSDFFNSPEGAIELSCYYEPLRTLVQEALLPAQPAIVEAVGDSH